MNYKGRKQKKGIAVVEFTIVSTVLLLLILSVASIGYYMYSLQTLNNMTRKAARLAAVCNISTASQTGIITSVIDENAPSDFEQKHLVIEYLDSSSTLTTTFDEIRYVRARITDYNYQFTAVLSFLGDSGLVETPEFETTLPAENLGVIRPNKNDADGSNTDC